MVLERHGSYQHSHTDAAKRAHFYTDAGGDIDTYRDYRDNHAAIGSYTDAYRRQSLLHFPAAGGALTAWPAITTYFFLYCKLGLALANPSFYFAKC